MLNFRCSFTDWLYLDERQYTNTVVEDWNAGHLNETFEKKNVSNLKI